MPSLSSSQSGKVPADWTRSPLGKKLLSEPYPALVRGRAPSAEIALNRHRPRPHSAGVACFCAQPARDLYYAVMDGDAERVRALLEASPPAPTEWVGDTIAGAVRLQKKARRDCSLIFCLCAVFSCGNLMTAAADAAAEPLHDALRSLPIGTCGLPPSADGPRRGSADIPRRDLQAVLRAAGERRRPHPLCPQQAGESAGHLMCGYIMSGRSPATAGVACPLPACFAGARPLSRASLIALSADWAVDGDVLPEFLGVRADAAGGGMRPQGASGEAIW